MPQINKTPKSLQPYEFHGVDLMWDESTENAPALCPFCGNDNRKFSVEVATGQFHCWTCGAGGNATTFLRKLWDEYDRETVDYTPLARERGLLYPDTLMLWQVVYSWRLESWLIPGYGINGKMSQLYKYSNRLYPTPTLGHKLHGMNLYNPNHDYVFLCEGPWDGMSLWEVLRYAEGDLEEVNVTANKQNNLLETCSVLAVPGAMVFFEQWCSLFSGKNVYLVYDNDHPRKHPRTGKTLPPAGLVGMKRTAEILSGAKEPPAEIHYLCWGEGGFMSDLPNGYDIRDTLSTWRK